MANVSTAMDTLNRLLRGELSAIETYKQALAKIGNNGGALELMRLEAEHIEAAELLRQHVAQRGGIPDFSSGAWGAFARSVEGTAQLFGRTAALKALKEGEEHGAKEYELALEDEDLDPEGRRLIASRLLPRQREHVPVLDRLMQAPRGG